MFGKLFSAMKNAPKSTRRYLRPSGTADLMIHASAKGPIHLALHNIPDAWSFETTGAAIGKGFDSGIVGRQVAFTPDATQAPQPSYKVIVVFDAPKDTGYQDLCDDAIPAPEPDDEDGGHSVIVVFCVAGERVAAAEGSAGPDCTPGTDAFNTWFRGIAKHLFAEPRERN